jgi:1-deoxy-D-xylulose-5-phosphate reductoisomerase
MKNICILGSTGSIGRSSLEVISRFPDRFRVTYLTTHRNTDLLREQISRFHPKGVCILDEHACNGFRKDLSGTLEYYAGEKGLKEIVTQPDVDIVISSLVGFAGLAPTIEAIHHGKTVALANKETLVVAGEIINALAGRHHAKIIPIDSEHSAILQCLEGENRASISKLILTASGGPFLNVEKKHFGSLSVEEALNHPKWKMGNKITIDSATLMNKGLEVIEAHWLFGFPPEKIEVIIHPQSIIHSMVEFVDGSVKAQLGLPDMKLPIQYALSYPERLQSDYARVDFAKLGSMTFFAPDLEKFECLRLAYEALQAGGTAPAILNAANEVAVKMFLNEEIPFDRIPELLRAALEKIPAKASPGIEDIIEADRITREFVENRVPKKEPKRPIATRTGVRRVVS